MNQISIAQNQTGGVFDINMGDNISKVEVDGNSNVISVSQDVPAGGGETLGSNSSVIKVVGSGNTATVVQK
jgi:hypothetical protein